MSDPTTPTAGRRELSVDDHLAQATFLFGSDGTLTVANDTATELIDRLDGGEIAPGDPVEAVIPPPLRDLTLELVDSAVAEETLRTRPVDLSTSLGSDARWELRCEPLQGDDADLLLVALRRLGDRHGPDDELRHRLILETATDGIITIDEEGIIQSVNPATERMFSYSREAMIGRNVKMLMPSPYRENHDEYLKRYGETGERHIIDTGREVEGKRKDGSTFPLYLGVGEADDGEHRFFTGILRDLSERKQLEKQLRHSAQMQALGQLAGGISHDFNNLLTVVSHCTRILDRGLAADADLRSTVDRLREAVDRGEALTEQLLAFHSNDARGTETVALNDLVANTEQFLRRLLGDDIAIDLELAEESTTVDGRPGQLKQVLTNLVINARDAMPRGGRLRIRTLRTDERSPNTSTTVGTVEPGTFVCVAVRDTGHGMDEATRRQIFEPLFTTKEGSEGTGLGLSTVYGIVDSHGGAIEVDSTPGEGTEFRVYLPASDARPAAESSAPSDDLTASVPDGATVLIVDDQPSLRTTMAQLLAEEGYEVSTVGDPRRALELCRQRTEPFDVLVTDLVLPNFDGAELADRIAAVSPETAVLFISGYAGETLRRKNLEIDGPILHKPFDFDDLLESLDRVLGR